MSTELPRVHRLRLGLVVVRMGWIPASWVVEREVLSCMLSGWVGAAPSSALGFLLVQADVLAATSSAITRKLG